MATVFTGLMRILSEMGVAAALIRRPEEIVEEEVLDTAFWTSLAVSGALFLMSALALAPLGRASTRRRRCVACWSWCRWRCW